MRAHTDRDSGSPTRADGDAPGKAQQKPDHLPRETPETCRNCEDHHPSCSRCGVDPGALDRVKGTKERSHLPSHVDQDLPPSDKEKYESEILYLNEEVSHLQAIVDQFEHNRERASEGKTQQGLHHHSNDDDGKSFLLRRRQADFQSADTAWTREQKELAKVRAQLASLQQEMLATVDLYKPGFDADFGAGFQALNKSIGKLSKHKAFTSLIFPNMERWDAEVLWPNTCHDRLEHDQLDDKEKKLLIRQAIWKFYSDRLLDRSQPFASFGGRAGALVSSVSFVDMFPEHLIDDKAGKWRAMTASRLNDLDDAAGRKETHARLCADLARLMHHRMHVEAVTEKELTELCSFGEVSKQLREMNDLAIDFVRALTRERAAFSLGVPDLKAIRYFKSLDHDLMTSNGSLVGVVVGGSEGEAEGQIRVLGSPILWKWGDPAGLDLEEKTLLVKAFVQLAEPTER